MSDAFATPTTRRMLARAATKGCPACGQRRLFRRWVQMIDDCPGCGLHFERIEGHWIGAVGINTAVCFGSLMITMIAGLVATSPDIPVVPLTLVSVAVGGLLPIVFYPFSKTIWTAIDVAMRPLEAHEVDWAVVGTPAAPDVRRGNKR